jgi:hypothetical protein
MPLDMPPDMWPERPEIDRDALALSVQKQAGYPLSFEDYAKIWNAVTKWMDSDGTRNDYSLGDGIFGTAAELAENE